MKLMLDIDIDSPSSLINYKDKIMLMGSCFTEHIGNSLQDLKFNVLQNPNGILFDVRSVSYSLISYIKNKKYEMEELVQLNELWHSWQHHSRFSNTDQEKCLLGINKSQEAAHEFLKKADWLIITLGSSFSYHLKEETAENYRKGVGNLRTSEFIDIKGGEVANCHRAPSQWFDKHLMTIEESRVAMEGCIHLLRQFNPGLNIVFTVSPVRHIRDGVIQNNISKARLIEAVHQLLNKFDGLYYFPAYELVIDVLRDYRFYDIDLVHPNFAATEFVTSKFMESYLDDQSRELAEEIKKIVLAKKHKPTQPGTAAHKKFLQSHLFKTEELLKRHPYLSLNEELEFFRNSSSFSNSIN